MGRLESFEGTADNSRLVAEYQGSVARYLSSLEELRAAEHRMRDLAALLSGVDGSPEESRVISAALSQRTDGEKGLAERAIEGLSAREFEVFALIGEGLATHEVAKQLSLATSTVETYRERLKSKLRLNSGAALTRHAILWAASQHERVAKS